VPKVVTERVRSSVYAGWVPVVCVRLSEEALTLLEARAARKGVDRSTWLRDAVRRALGAEGADVEAMMPRPPASITPLVPGDTLTVLEPGGLHP
jgi:hypothetical protein